MWSISPINRDQAAAVHPQNIVWYYPMLYVIFQKLFEKALTHVSYRMLLNLQT